MRYFRDVKVGQELFSLIYAKGIVTFVLPKEQRVDGFYIFAVEYSKKRLFTIRKTDVLIGLPMNGIVKLFFIKKILT